LHQADDCTSLAGRRLVLTSVCCTWSRRPRCTASCKGAVRCLTAPTLGAGHILLKPGGLPAHWATGNYTGAQSCPGNRHLACACVRALWRQFSRRSSTVYVALAVYHHLRPVKSHAQRYVCKSSFFRTVVLLARRSAEVQQDVFRTGRPEKHARPYGL
jgi:hypothetical protein